MLGLALRFGRPVGRAADEALHAQHNAVGRGNADSRRTAHLQLADGLPDVLRRRQPQINRLFRKQALIQQRQRVIIPDEGLKHLRCGLLRFLGHSFVAPLDWYALCCTSCVMPGRRNRRYG